MKPAVLVARAGCLAVRALVALQPRDFRAAFGGAVVHDTTADIMNALPSGTFATLTAVTAAVADAARGVAVERLASFNAFRRAMLNALMSDVRHAVRTLARSPGFTSVALGTLSVGLALCVVVAVLVNAYLVRGLPYPESHRLFDVRYAAPGTPWPVDMEKLEWASLGDVIELPIAWDLDSFNLRGGAYPEALQGTWVTKGYVEGFGVQPAFGRGFLPSDFETGRPNVALISHRLWQSRFGGDPAVIGRSFVAYVNDRPDEVEAFEVAGVLPERHWHLNAFTEILVPLRAPTYPYIVRLREGVPPAIAVDRISALVRTGNSALPADWRVELVSTHGSYVQQIRPLLLAVATATSLVLLIACANVAVLLTVRATERRREMAVRQALGATAAQITRAVGAEPAVLGVAAAVLGVTFAWVTIAVIAPVMDHYLGRPAPGGVTALTMNAPIVLGALAAGLLAIATCSIVPLWIARRTPVSLALTGGQKGGTEGPAHRRARSVHIAIEVAACLTLLVGAGLTIQSAVGMLRVEMGLDAGDVLVGRFSLRQRTYPGAAARNAFYERVLARSGELSGVRGIAFTNSWPLQATLGRDVGAGEATTTFATRSGVVAVSPDYFATLKIAAHDGRTFNARDRVGTEPVAVVSRTLAARLWPSGGAIGQRLRVGPAPNSPAGAPTMTPVVVGVVGDIRHAHTDNDVADAYLSILQFPTPSPFVYLRVSGDSAATERAFRELLASIDGDVALAAPRRLADILDLQRAGSRLLAYLLVIFAVFAAVLALVGIYGVIAYTVRLREREIAVRLAMGADGGRITRMFIKQGATVLAAGLAIGVAGAVALGRVLQAQLFGVKAADPSVIAAMVLTFAVCGLLAVSWPARIAASTDPASALKE